MCSRFEFNPPKSEMAKLFADFDLADQPWDHEIADLGPILRPTNQICTITPGQDQGTGQTRVMSWGLRPPWMTGAKPAGPLINARAESLEQKPTFQPLLNFRCLVPATAYFEWRHHGAARLKNRIWIEDAPVFAFAALASGPFSTDPHSALSATIITCEPARAIAHIHNRMPVILPRDAYAAWLDPKVEFGAVRRWLAPYPGSQILNHEDRPAQPDLFG